MFNKIDKVVRKMISLLSIYICFHFDLAEFRPNYMNFKSVKKTSAFIKLSLAGGAARSLKNQIRRAKS